MKTLNPIVREILKKRGITDQKETEEFLSDKPQLTYDPLLLSNMQEGVDFLITAIKNKDRICIYGDYDVDGITATALLYNFLITLSDSITYYIPSRFDEGYGLNKESLLHLRESGTDIIITVDCGAVSKKEVEYASSIGLKVMVTDHHNMEESTTPDCIVINPKHYNSEYPFTELCGCAVVFKLIQAVINSQNLDRKFLARSLDLVAIATVADVVPLIKENRTIVKYGLRELKRGTRKALRIMMHKLELKPENIDSYKIGFVIGPHMNAAGRMSDANAVVRMLTIDDNREINKIVEMLIMHNRERKSVQEECLNECIEIIEKNYLDHSFLVVKPLSIHEGIAGIVAGRIKEIYNKPAIVLSGTSSDRSETKLSLLKGSGRSIENVNLINLLLSHEEVFTKLGGHAMAAGFTIPEENVSKLRDLLNEDMRHELERNPLLLTKTINTDYIINDYEIDLALAKDLKLLSPFGVGNPKPVLELDSVTVENIKYMGTERQHVKFNSGSLECVLFSRAQDYKGLLESQGKATLYGSPDINLWNGKENIQFLIKALKIQEEETCSQ